MGTTRLQLYNDALTLCGERYLASLEETGKPRRLLDQVWASNGVRYCLEQGQWQFAMRTEMITADPDVDTQFGYSNVFDKPDDWVLTSALCSDEFMRVPLVLYRDEGDYWFADIDPIYVSYVSNDANYGGDLSKWPASFCDYAAAEFAAKIIHSLTADSQKVQALFGRPGDIKGGELSRRRLIAKSRAAMTQATQRPAPGSWSRSRGGRQGRGPMGDGGSPGSLTG